MQFPRTKHQQWEYHQVIMPLDKSTQVLDDLGQDGWEAYSVFPLPGAPNVLDHSPRIVVMLKRKA